VLAVLGTLSLEFTRLSQITGNDKYFDGIQRIMNELEKWQDHTSLPGMWPAKVNSAVVNQMMSTPLEHWQIRLMSIFLRLADCPFVDFFFG